MLDYGTWMDHFRPYLLVAASNPEIGLTICSVLRQHDAVPVLVENGRQVAVTMRDAQFMDTHFDGLLIDYLLPDSCVYHVVNEFREIFPDRPVAVINDREDLCLKMWARARGIVVFRRPMVTEELNLWLPHLKAAAMEDPSVLSAR